MMARFAGFYTAQGLPSNRVLSLHQSTDGTLWSGTREGLVRFERDHVAAAALPERVGFLGDSSLASDVRGRRTNRRLWAVESLRGEAISGRIPGGRSQGLRCSYGSERRVWFGCGMTRLRIPERKSVRIGRKQGVPKDIWNAIFTDHEGNLWIRSSMRLMTRSRLGRQFSEVQQHS